MQLVKLTTEKISNLFKALICLLSITYCQFAQAQDNSPYSRYGIGDLVPSMNVANRGMGRITAGFNDFRFINFSNPASYTSFQAAKEIRTTKLQSGRTIFDIGVNYDSRILRESNNPEKFKAQNLLFSYMQVGMPLRSNWGLTFGLRPVSRISYNIRQTEFVDTIGENVATLYTGDGGSYLPNIGTAVKIKKLSIGINAGYLFGKKDYSTRRGFQSDSVEFKPSNHQTKTVFGNIFLQGGLQYSDTIKRDPKDPHNMTILTIGASGNLGTTLNAHQDRIVETFIRDQTLGDIRLDSVYEQSDVKGKLEYPGSFTVGFTVGNNPFNLKKANWMFGVDFTATAWSDYRFYGATDFTQNTWELKVGGHLRPIVRTGYFSAVTYRTGFFIGPDYINVGKKLSQFGATFGMGLPIANYNRLAQGQYTLINLAVEYNKRGNNGNLLKEDLFRVSLGLSLSDLWFIKRKYE
jgi:hypothetical protein